MENSALSLNSEEPTDYLSSTEGKKVLDMPMKEYLAVEGINSGILATAKKSLLHYLHATTAEDKDTPARVIGRLAHTLTFEPSKLNSLYDVSKFADKRSSAYKDWFASLDGTKEVVTAEQYDIAANIAASVRSHPLYKSMEKGSQAEVSVFWTDYITQAKCKARFDLLNEGLCLVADLKTTTDASAKGFARQCMGYGYANKAAWYASAYEAITGDRLDSFIYLAAEKDPPYACCFYRVGEDMLRHGETENRFLLHKIADGIKSKEFPGYSNELVDLNLPPYAQLELPEL